MAEKVKATIKTGSGVEIVIESDRRTVQEIVSEIHRREESRVRFREEFEKRRELERKRFIELRQKRNELVHGESKNHEKERNRAKTKMDVFADLIRQGFFNESRNLGEVQKVLEEKGYHYPVTSLSPTLLRLVRKGELRRTKQIKDDKEMWVYNSGDGK